MEDSVAIRLKLFMDKIGVSNSEFADKCGIPRPTLSQLITGRNKKVSDVLVGQIHKQYPSLSIVWLLFGEGEMLKEEKNIPFKPTLFDSEDDILDNSSHFENTENHDFPKSPHAKFEYGKENGLTDDSNRHLSNTNYKNDNDLQNRILKNEIEFLKLNPRKVVQITIYYDDSTFETFTPGNIKA